jgi:hypothetical protein
MIAFYYGDARRGEVARAFEPVKIVRKSVSALAGWKTRATPDSQTHALPVSWIVFSFPFLRLKRIGGKTSVSSTFVKKADPLWTGRSRSEGRSLRRTFAVAPVGNYLFISTHVAMIRRGTGFPTRESGNEFPYDLHGLESPCHFFLACVCQASRS